MTAAPHWVVLDIHYALPLVVFTKEEDLAGYLKRASWKENLRIYSYQDGVVSSIGAVQFEYDEIIKKYGNAEARWTDGSSAAKS